MKSLAKSIVLIAFAFSAINANAKFSHRTNGQIIIGEESTDVANVSNNSKDTITALKIHGPFSEWRAGGRLSFGDQASKYNMNVLIGELGLEDSDRLWLHGKYGMYFTTNPSAQDTIFYYDIERGTNFHFNCDVHADGIFVASDQRFKENISPLNTSLTSLKSIAAVSYTLKPKFTNKPTNRSGTMSEKDARDQKHFDQYYNDINNDAIRYGFIAQEVQKIYPELVRTDKSGYMYVDYIGMIPILVNAINELQDKIDLLESEDLRKTKSIQNESVEFAGSIETEAIVSSLKQNKPNPFNSETIISYSLPESVTNAQLYVYNMQGRQISKYELTERGNCSLTISASEFEAGMYIYTLIADGKEIDSKRMILTK